jgi:exonuclease VII large subunit
MNYFSIVGKIQGIRPQNNMAYLCIMVKATKDKADFIDCVCFGKTSEFLQKYFKEGKWIEVQGHISKSKYNDTWRQELIATRLGFCGAIVEEDYKPPKDVDYNYVGGVPDEDDGLPF